MAAPQPFPLLASASNSRAASPALSANASFNDRSNVRDAKQRSVKGGRHKKNRQNKTDGQEGSASSSNNNGNGNGNDGKKAQDRRKEATATATQPATAPSSDADSAANNTSNNPLASRKKSTKRRPKKQKNPVSAVAVPEAAADSANGDATPSKQSARGGGGRRHTAQPTTTNTRENSGKKGTGQRNRGKAQNSTRQHPDASAVNETAASSRASSSLSQATAPQSASPRPMSPPQYIRSSTGGPLSGAMIVPGENGRARVYFGSQPNDDHSSSDHQYPPVHPAFHAGAPRFLPSNVQQRRSSMGHFGLPRARFPVSYGDGHMPLGLSSPMSPAPQSTYYSQASHLHANSRSVTSPAPAPYAYQPPPAHPTYNVAPPSFRQRSMTSTQLRSTARSFSPQMQNVGYQSHSQSQQSHTAPNPMRRLSSATSVSLDHAGMYNPPLSAPIVGLAAGTRGRSQSVLTHSSTAGLRISMSQSRPGNVLAPHMPSLSRTSSNGSTGQPGTSFANGGYFASRRASVSSAGLAVDPNNTIRIPAIMFQKPSAEDQAASAGANASASPSTAATAAASPSSSAAPAAPSLVTPMSAVDEKAAGTGASDQIGSETLAMRRLQDMIESMRKLSNAKPAPKDSHAAVPTPPLSASESGSAPAPKPAAPSEAAAALATAAEPSAVAAPSIALPPTPAAHPTSRFDSILEEDEDSEDDEAKLDADAESDPAARSPALAARDVSAEQSTTVSAVCAL
ncbi:hypothetical protein IW140_002877 [Coemansia sp. RSA 1813]|nr:hypothetical protein EV178_002797 [Coemansia sp. RSA 1646]KAJ2214807.1 hypothetical protein EV179_002755 [Coemansia sp. RSA 487]KAJ2569796.1 hypothetical protein IW140_002877 [Coemansia sp. RSA 1813]